MTADLLQDRSCPLCLRMPYVLCWRLSFSPLISKLRCHFYMEALPTLSYTAATPNTQQLAGGSFISPAFLLSCFSPTRTLPESAHKVWDEDPGEDILSALDFVPSRLALCLQHRNHTETIKMKISSLRSFKTLFSIILVLDSFPLEFMPGEQMDFLLRNY